MTTAALSAVSSWTSQLREFLREELAPTPERWQQTLRITLACVIASWAVMAFHLKFSLLVLILMFLVTQRDTASTLLLTFVGIIGAAIGCGLMLLTYMSVTDIAWLRVLLVPVYIALGLYINRIFTLGPVGSAIGIPVAIGMVIPDITPFLDGPPRPYEGGPPRVPFYLSTENLSRFPFNIWWAITFGLLVSLGVQYVLKPTSGRSFIVSGLRARLEALEAALLHLADGKGRPAQSATLLALAVEGPAKLLGLLKVACALNPSLKPHRAQLGAQIILVDQLVTAAATLEQQEVNALSEQGKKRLRRLAGLAANWRSALPELRWPELPEPVPTSPSSPDKVPAVEQMERVAELVSAARSGQPLSEELTAIPEALKSGLFVSDAFRNPDYLRSSIKGALAGLICYLIFTLANYQEIFTSVITCIVCSLSTVGASFQKGTLRFCGSAIGGLLGMLTLIYVFPHLDSIAGFWLPFAAVTALAAYITQGSPAISYAGYQIGLAFYKCTLQTYGPYSELRVLRDRLIGILLGLVVFELINTRLWPVRAMDTMRARLRSSLRALGEMAALTDKVKPTKSLLWQANELRMRATQDLLMVRQLSLGAKFEPGAPARRELAELTAKAEKLLVLLLAIAQHESDLPQERLPEPTRRAYLHLNATLALFLRNVGEQVAEHAASALPELLTPLRALEQAVAAHLRSVSDAAAASHLEARLQLCRQAVSITSQMV